VAEIRTEILVIGGGPAGLAAAEAAGSHGKQVAVIDENPEFGGQIWRAEKGKLSGKANELVEALVRTGVKMFAGSTCVAALDGKRILALANGVTFPIAYRKLIIATGARERFIPFPGWTLPGVYGAGGLQALVKGGYDIAGKRIVVAGTGPLLLAVAGFLKKKGGEVVLVAERTSGWKLAKLGLAAVRVPGKLSEAIALRKELRGIRFRTSTVVTKAGGKGRLSSITIARGGREKTIECDIAAVGWHLVPNLEIAQMFGCALPGGFVLTDEHMRTSVDDVFAAGEVSSIGGLQLSLIEGRIAGLASAGKAYEAESLESDRSRHRRFASALHQTFSIKAGELRGLPANDTIVCRCEDVLFGRIRDLRNFTEAKLQTRLGMGFCQGRVCGGACESLFGWEANTVRPPIVPVPLSALANFKTENK